MLALGVLASVLYFVNLTASGYANTYYAMAAQAASQSWSAFLFGSLDAGGFITLDKGPLATWLMGLSVRAFGLSSLAILLPQALLGVGTVIVLYLAVRRSFGVGAAVLAGLLMALTPVAGVIFRYDNPDAMLTFLLVCAAWALGRALIDGRLRWLLLSAAFVGGAFLTKYLEAFIILPGFTLAWLACAPVTFRRRLVGLTAAALAVMACSFWWVAIVQLIPVDARPYVGGTTTNSVVDLILGYDGLGRILGGGAGIGSPASAAPGLAPNVVLPAPQFAGDPGPLRLLNDQLGGQIGWIIPAAVIAIGVAAVLHRRAARTDPRLSGYLMWGVWFVLYGIVLSFMADTSHAYYAVVLVPPTAALVGAAIAELRVLASASQRAALALAGMVTVAGVTSFILLARTPTFCPGLGTGVLVAALVVAFGIVAIARLAANGRIPMIVALTVSVGVFAAGPIAYDAVTMMTSYGSADPIAGPTPAGSLADPLLGPSAACGGAPCAATVDPTVIEFLVAHRGPARWIVATGGAQIAAQIQLVTRSPVMTLGGFSGVDPTPTPGDLAAATASGVVRYLYVWSSSPSAAIQVSTGEAYRGWIAGHCVEVSSDAALTGLYDCSPHA